jgi:predicted ATPase
MVSGHRAMGDSFLHLGQLGPARAHFEQGLALYDPVEHRTLTLLFAENARVAMLSFLSLTLALLGFPDQARAQSAEAIAQARGLSHPISVAFALSLSCRLYYVLQDASRVRELADDLISLTREQHFAFFLAMGTAYRGWSLVEGGDVGAGTDLIRTGIAGFRASGATWILPFYLAQLATAHTKAGRVEDGFAQLSEALVLTEESKVRWFEAELHRRRGELLDSAGSVTEAEACLRRAITIARHQAAKLWELRATTDLARIWRDQGKRSEAKALLAPVYGWFSEALDLPDLKRAKKVLDGLL